MQQIDGFQIADAVPMDDGSLTTRLLDGDGYEVATVTRRQDGSATASVQTLDATPGGGDFDWAKVLGKVTSFLNQVAQSAQSTADQTRRVSNAVQGAAAGAQAGYNAPLDWKPWAVAGVAIVVAGVAIASRKSNPPRRRRRSR